MQAPFYSMRVSECIVVVVVVVVPFSNIAIVYRTGRIPKRHNILFLSLSLFSLNLPVAGVAGAGAGDVVG